MVHLIFFYYLLIYLLNAGIIVSTTASKPAKTMLITDLKMKMTAYCQQLQSWLRRVLESIYVLFTCSHLSLIHKESAARAWHKIDGGFNLKWKCSPWLDKFILNLYLEFYEVLFSHTSKDLWYSIQYLTCCTLVIMNMTVLYCFIKHITYCRKELVLRRDNSTIRMSAFFHLATVISNRFNH